MEHAGVPVAVRTIMAGKLRRYHGVSIWRQLFDVPTVLRNIIDIFKFVAGFIQSLWLILSFRPQVVFAKGGYVCLPVGLAAYACRVPLMIHDSDARPGLTNRLLAGFADRIATGSPLENYPYDPAISRYVGVPIEPEFHPFSDDEKRTARQAMGLVDIDRPLLVVTGGGLGSRMINQAVASIAEDLVDSGMEIYHITGRGHVAEVEKIAPHHPLYHLVPFVYKDMANVLGAADIVISRGSATFLQELAALKKPVIVIPAGQLGDQIKNATVYKQADAAIVLQDEELRQPGKLLDAIRQLINHPAEGREMAARLHDFARPEAALDTAEMIVEAAGRKGKGKLV